MLFLTVFCGGCVSAGYCCLQMTTGSLYELNLIKLGNVRSVARQFATVGNGNMADNMADTVAMATTENNTQGNNNNNDN